MRQKYIFAFLAIIAVVANITGILRENFWLKNTSEALFIFPLIGYYYRKLPLKNINFFIFFLMFISAATFSIFAEFWYFKEFSLGLWLGVYIFLIREAIKHTEHEKGSKFTVLYFIGIIGIYCYLLSLHVLEIEQSLNNGYVLSLYIIYYLNILILAGVALVYYLNSFSRKSVFFVSLTLAFIFSDVLRDMETFYFQDLSVELTGSLIRLGAINLVFLFFVTGEKKLRLLHLV